MKANIGELCNHDAAGSLKQMPSDQLVLPNCCMGIELEWEQAKIQCCSMSDSRDMNVHWHVMDDSSLRGDWAVEAKFASPLAGQNIIDAFNTMARILHDYEIKPVLSRRASTHAHLDIRDLTFAQFINLTALYTTFERMLFNWVGEDRMENIYCLPMHHIVGDVQGLRDLREDGLSKQLSSLFGREAGISGSKKYAAFNVSAVTQFGSIEFRHMAGCYDFDRILTWINIIQCMKKYVIENEDVKLTTMPHMISAMGEESFVNSVFGKYAERLKYIGFERDMRAGIRLAQIFIYGENFMDGTTWIREKLWHYANTEDVSAACPNFWNNRASILESNTSAPFDNLFEYLIKE